MIDKNEQTPFFSVIIPLYNAEKYIEQTIESVLLQTFTDYEIIICNDGSTDRGFEIVSHKYRKIDYIKLIDGKNSGLPAVARNKAIKESKGKYLAFLDADDYWVENKLESAYEVLKDGNFVALSTDIQIIDDKERILDNHYRNRLFPPKSGVTKFKQLIKVNFFATSATIISKDIYNKIGGFDESFNMRGIEDYLMWLRVLQYGDAYYDINKLTYYRENNPESIRKKDSSINDRYRKMVLIKKLLSDDIRIALPNLPQILLAILSIAKQELVFRLEKVKHLKNIISKKFIFVSTFFVALLLIVPLYDVKNYSNKVYIDVDSADSTKVAIVFGAGVVNNSTPSHMLEDRLLTAYDLYINGKAEYILVSGDNRFHDYNEPKVMSDYLTKKGIPQDKIILDYAGRRTYDTCARANEIWGIDDAILVTQGYHLYRALFVCNHLGVNSYGLSASRREYISDSWNKTREILAIYKSYIDIYVWKPSYVSGEPLDDIR